MFAQPKIGKNAVPSIGCGRSDLAPSRRVKWGHVPAVERKPHGAQPLTGPHGGTTATAPGYSNPPGVRHQAVAAGRVKAPDA